MIFREIEASDLEVQEKKIISNSMKSNSSFLLHARKLELDYFSVSINLTSRNPTKNRGVSGQRLDSILTLKLCFNFLASGIRKSIFNIPLL